MEVREEPINRQMDKDAVCVCLCVCWGGGCVCVCVCCVAAVKGRVRLCALEATICPVFSPFSLFGHSCCFKTVPLSLLQVVAGTGQPALKGLILA